MPPTSLSDFDPAAISGERLARWLKLSDFDESTCATHLGISTRTLRRYLAAGVPRGPVCVAIRHLFELQGVLNTQSSLPTVALSSALSRLEATLPDLTEHQRVEAEASFRAWYMMLAELFDAESLEEFPVTSCWREPEQILDIMRSLLEFAPSHQVFVSIGPNAPITNVRENTHLPGAIELERAGVWEVLPGPTLHFHMASAAQIDTAYFILDTTEADFSTEPLKRPGRRLCGREEGGFLLEPSSASEEAEEVDLLVWKTSLLIVSDASAYNAFTPHTISPHAVLGSEAFADYMAGGPTTWSDRAGDLALKNKKHAENLVMRLHKLPSHQDSEPIREYKYPDMRSNPERYDINWRHIECAMRGEKPSSPLPPKPGPELLTAHALEFIEVMRQEFSIPTDAISACPPAGNGVRELWEEHEVETVQDHDIAAILCLSPDDPEKALYGKLKHDVRFGLYIHELKRRLDVQITCFEDPEGRPPEYGVDLVAPWLFSRPRHGVFGGGWRGYPQCMLRRFLVFLYVDCFSAASRQPPKLTRSTSPQPVDDRFSLLEHDDRPIELRKHLPWTPSLELSIKTEVEDEAHANSLAAFFALLPANLPQGWAQVPLTERERSAEHEILAFQSNEREDTLSLIHTPYSIHPLPLLAVRNEKGDCGWQAPMVRQKELITAFFNEVLGQMSLPDGLHIVWSGARIRA